jgi:hypothetical protein
MRRVVGKLPRDREISRILSACSLQAIKSFASRLPPQPFFGFCNSLCNVCIASGTHVHVRFSQRARASQSEGAPKFDRLKALKHRYGLDNVFGFNQNIGPN